jgi:hypothetical protein
MSDTSHVSRDTISNVDYFDCTGKADGTYVHPTDCTRYITCTKGTAADVACPECDHAVRHRRIPSGLTPQHRPGTRPGAGPLSIIMKSFDRWNDQDPS